MLKPNQIVENFNKFQESPEWKTYSKAEQDKIYNRTLQNYKESTRLYGPKPKMDEDGLYNSHVIADNFNKLKQSERWQTLPKDQQEELTKQYKLAYKHQNRKYQSAPIITPFDKTKKVNYEDVTPLTTAENFVESAARIPHAFESTLASGIGYGLDLVGADNAAKTMYDTSAQMDKQAQELFPSTFKPVQDIGEITHSIDSWGNFGKLAGKVVAGAPEVIGSSYAMAALAAIAAKGAKILGLGKKAIDLARVGGLGVGSTLTSGGGMQQSEYQQTGELGNAMEKLPYALGSGALDFLPGTMEQAGSKRLAKFLGAETVEKSAKELADESLKLANRSLLRKGIDGAKGFVTRAVPEMVQESSQSLIEGSQPYSNLGFIESLKKGFQDPKVQGQAAMEGLTAAISAEGSHHAHNAFSSEKSNQAKNNEALDIIRKLAGDSGSNDNNDGGISSLGDLAKKEQEYRARAKSYLAEISRLSSEGNSEGADKLTDELLKNVPHSIIEQEHAEYLKNQPGQEVQDIQDLGNIAPDQNNVAGDTQEILTPEEEMKQRRSAMEEAILNAEIQKEEAQKQAEVQAQQQAIQEQQRQTDIINQELQKKENLKIVEEKMAKVRAESAKKQQIELEKKKQAEIKRREEEDLNRATSLYHVVKNTPDQSDRKAKLKEFNTYPEAVRKQAIFEYKQDQMKNVSSGESKAPQSPSKATPKNIYKPKHVRADETNQAANTEYLVDPVQKAKKEFVENTDNIPAPKNEIELFKLADGFARQYANPQNDFKSYQAINEMVRDYLRPGETKPAGAKLATGRNVKPLPLKNDLDVKAPSLAKAKKSSNLSSIANKIRNLKGDYTKNDRTQSPTNISLAMPGRENVSGIKAGKMSEVESVKAEEKPKPLTNLVNKIKKIKGERTQEPVTKSAYKVEPKLGGWAVIAPDGSQQSWGTSKKAIQQKADNLNNSKTEAVKHASEDVRTATAPSNDVEKTQEVVGEPNPVEPKEITKKDDIKFEREDYVLAKDGAGKEFTGTYAGDGKVLRDGKVSPEVATAIRHVNFPDVSADKIVRGGSFSAILGSDGKYTIYKEGEKLYKFEGSDKEAKRELLRLRGEKLRGYRHVGEFKAKGEKYGNWGVYDREGKMRSMVTGVEPAYTKMEALKAGIKTGSTANAERSKPVKTSEELELYTIDYPKLNEKLNKANLAYTFKTKGYRDNVKEIDQDSSLSKDQKKTLKKILHDSTTLKKIKPTATTKRVRAPKPTSGYGVTPVLPAGPYDLIPMKGGYLINGVIGVISDQLPTKHKSKLTMKDKKSGSINDVFGKIFTSEDLEKESSFKLPSYKKTDIGNSAKFFVTDGTNGVVYTTDQTRGGMAGMEYVSDGDKLSGDLSFYRYDTIAAVQALLDKNLNFVCESKGMLLLRTSKGVNVVVCPIVKERAGGIIESYESFVKSKTLKRVEAPKPVAKTEKVEKTKAKSTSEKSKLEDVGQKLGGAKKDRVRNFEKNVSDADLASKKLSELFPKKIIDKTEDPLMAAALSVIRSTIPSKPRRTYAVRRWAEKVKCVLDLAKKFEESNRESLLKQMEDGRSSALRDVAFKIRLLEKMDRSQWGRIGELSYYPTAQDTNGNPDPSIHVYIDGRGKWIKAPNGFDERLIQEIMGRTKENGEAAPKTKSRMRFEVRGSSKLCFINKVGDSEYTRLKTFTSIAEARDYLKNNHDELVKAWEKHKEEFNVKKADVRKKTNRDRVGSDYRHGKDVSAEEFRKTFGFRGVEFGNWVSQGKNLRERQGMINAAYDSLMDLATILKIAPEAISLNGSLGLGLGSRGFGNAAAHYEPSNIVINLTKTKGAGSLAHEWFHAMDNYFQLERGTIGKGREGHMITNKPEAEYVRKDTIGGTYPLKLSKDQYKHKVAKNSPYFDPEQWVIDPEHSKNVRSEVEEAFGDLVRALDASPMTKRSRAIDKGKKDGYWSRILERAARAFESYIMSKMAKEGYMNDYLANVTPASDFVRNQNRYPYLLDSELEPVEKAFDKLFDTIDTKPTSKGIKLYSVEHAALEYTIKGMKKAAKVLEYGAELLSKGVIRFSKWASSMVEKFGKAKVSKFLRSLYNDAYRVFRSRRGVIKLSGLKNVLVDGRGEPGFTNDKAGADQTFQRINNVLTMYDPRFFSDGRITSPLSILRREDKISFDKNSAQESSDLARFGNTLFRREQATRKLYKVLGVEPHSTISDWVRDVASILIDKKATSEDVKAEISEYNKAASRLNEKLIESESQIRRDGNLYSIEYIAAKAIYKGYKLAKKAIAHGVDLLEKNINKLSQWSKNMIKKFGEDIKPYLINMFADARKILSSKRGAIGDRFSKIEENFPIDNVEPKVIDPKAKNMLQQVAAEFRSWPNSIKAADGNEILLHNPEGGSLGKRVHHLIRGAKNKKVNPKKVEWVANIPETLKNATARMVDAESGNKLYVRAYKNGDKHIVVVRPDGSISTHGLLRGKLITQFKYESDSRQSSMIIDWENPSKIKTAGAAKSDNSNLDREAVASKSDNGSKSLDKETLREPAVTKNINKTTYSVKKGSNNKLHIPKDKSQSDKTSSDLEKKPDIEGKQSDQLDDLSIGIAEERNDDSILGALEEVEAKDVRDGEHVKTLFKDLFNKNIVFFKSNHSSGVFFNGVVSSDDSNTIFIDAAADKPVLTIAGHELLHTLKLDEPKLYDSLQTELSKQMKKLNVYQNKLKKLSGVDIGKDRAKEELIADFMGDQMSDKKFWNKLAVNKPSVFMKIASKLMEIFSDISRWIKSKGFGSKAFFRDVAKSKKVLGEILTKYAESKNPAVKGLAEKLKSMNKAPTTEKLSEAVKRVSKKAKKNTVESSRDASVIEKDIVDHIHNNKDVLDTQEKVATEERKWKSRNLSDAWAWVNNNVATRSIKELIGGLKKNFSKAGKWVSELIKSAYKKMKGAYIRVKNAVKSTSKKRRADSKLSNLLRGKLSELERRQGRVSWAKNMLVGRDVLEAAMENAKDIVSKTPGTRAVYFEADIINQKGVNSFFGENTFEVDEKVLSEFAKILKEQIDQISYDDLTSKAGGDEWGSVLIVPEKISDEDIKNALKVAHTKAVAYASSVKNQKGEVLRSDLTNPRAKNPAALKEALERLTRLGEKDKVGHLFAEYAKDYGKYLTAQGVGFRIGIEAIKNSTPKEIADSIAKQFEAQKNWKERKDVIEKVSSNIRGIKRGFSRTPELGQKTSDRVSNLESDLQNSGDEIRDKRAGRDTGLQFSRKSDIQGISDSVIADAIEKAQNKKELMDDDGRSITRQLVDFSKNGLVKLTSELSEEDPAFKFIKELNPEAKTFEELLRELRVNKTVRASEAKDQLLGAHIRADNSKLIDKIIKFTPEGPLRDWLLKKMRRIIAPVVMADKFQNALYMLAERVHWNGEEMVASPGFRQIGEDGEYYYDWGDSLLDGETALKAFNKLAPEWKDVLTERAKKNEEYRQEFVNKWIPQKRAELGLAVMSKLMDRFNKGTKAEQKETKDRFDKVMNEVETLLLQLSDNVESNADKAALEKLEDLYTRFENGLEKGFVKIPQDMLPDANRRFDKVYSEFINLEGNEGHYGYVHHYLESELATGDSKAGKKKGNSPGHPWFKSKSDSHRQRAGVEGQGSLLEADLTQASKDSNATAKNQWLESVENNFGISYDSALDENGDIRLPDGYSKNDWVTGNFGIYAGRKIFLPSNIIQVYENTLVHGKVDPEIEDISKTLAHIDNAVNLINASMLWHPTKFMRDLFSVPFHLIEFFRDYGFKNPRDVLALVPIMLKATKDTFSVSNWQKNTPESFGEYSESLGFMKGAKDSLITRLLDYIGGDTPLGQLMSAFFNEINLAGAGDLPVKRFLTSVGEQLADKKNLSGQERERFVYKLWNEYAYDTANLPLLMSYIRGQRPDKTSKVLGSISRASVPFMGYVTRLARQMIIQPFTHGIFGWGKRQNSLSKEVLYRSAELSRPIMWLALATLVRAGGLGNPPEDEGAADGLQNRSSLDYAARTASRLLIGKDKDKSGGEYYMNVKGLAQLGLMDNMLAVLQGKQKFSDITQELGSIGPVAKTLLSLIGMNDPYSKNIPVSAKIGRMAAMALVPQFTRLGPDIEKLLRLVLKDGAMPDRTREGFFTAFLSQLGAPVTEAKYRNGELVVTKKWVEALKYAGVNIKYIPYNLVAGELDKELPSIKKIRKKIEKLQGLRKPWEKEGITQERWLVKKGLWNKGRTLEKARKALEDDLKKRESGIKQTADALRKVGIVSEFKDTKKKDKSNYGSEAARKELQRILRKMKNQ